MACAVRTRKHSEGWSFLACFTVSAGLGGRAGAAGSAGTGRTPGAADPAAGGPRSWAPLKT
jgi:hypothetical protein